MCQQSDHRGCRKRTERVRIFSIRFGALLRGGFRTTCFYPAHGMVTNRNVHLHCRIHLPRRLARLVAHSCEGQRWKTSEKNHPIQLFVNDRCSRFFPPTEKKDLSCRVLDDAICYTCRNPLADEGEDDDFPIDDHGGEQKDASIDPK